MSCKISSRNGSKRNQIYLQIHYFYHSEYWSFSFELLSVLFTGKWRGGKIAGRQILGMFYRILLLFTQYWSSAINSHSKIISQRETNFICTNYNLDRALDIRTKINAIRIQVSFLTLLEEGQNIHGSPQTNIPRCLPSPALSDTTVDNE